MRISSVSNRRVFRQKALFACLLLILITGVAGAVEKDERSHAAGNRAIRDGEYQKAVKVFLDLVALDSGDVRAHLGAALAYYKLQDYKLTFEQATEALKLDDKSARAHALSGIALLRSGYLDHAVAELLQALQLNSKEALAWGGLAEIDYYTNRTKESREKASYAI